MSSKFISNGDYQQWVAQIKSKIQQSQVKAALQVNHELIILYWLIGEEITQKEKNASWGDKLLPSLSKDLMHEFPDMKGFSLSNLKYIRRWYQFYQQEHEIGQQLVDQLEKTQTQLGDIPLGDTPQRAQNISTQPTHKQPSVDDKLLNLLGQIPWGHHIQIITRTSGVHEALFYLIQTLENNWSRSILQLQITSQLYHRQGKTINNFAHTLPEPQADLARETLKSPYNFDFLMLSAEVQERELEKALIDNIKKFLLELGKGFAYVGNQYNLTVEEDDYFLDLLFFNTHLDCYVVFELKIGDFKPEYAGKLNFYINTVNQQIKKANHKSTIGVLLCRTPNKTVIEYSLQGLNTPLGVANYYLSPSLPEELSQDLPTVEELEAELTKEIELEQNRLQQKIQQLQNAVNKIQQQEIQEERSDASINKVIEHCLYPLYEKIQQKSIEVRKLFRKATATFWLGSTGYQEQDFKKAISDQLSGEQKMFYDVSIECRLEGFQKQGTNIIEVDYSLYFHFDRFKYSLKIDKRKKDELIEKLYHQLLNDKELDIIAEQVVDQIIDDIQERIQNL